MNTRNSPRTLRDWPVYVQPKPGPSGSSPLCERLRRDGKWAVCSTADVPDKATHVMQIEDALIRRASARPGLACVVARADKKGQNLINRTGDRDGAGSAALALSMDVLAETMQTVYGAGCGKPFLMRDSPISDESTLIAAGDLNFLSRIGDARFNDIYGKVRRARMARLEEYQYDARKLVFGPGGREAVELVPMDLERYANALKNPELVAESHVSRPQVVPPEMLRPGFVHDAIIRAEGEELWFVPRMPAAFSPVLQSSGLVPELRKHKPMILPPGISAVEVKFSHTDEGDRRAPLDFIGQTKKGLSEILSGRFGLRYINTYMGKQAANHLLALTARAMKDVENQGAPVGRTDSNLIFIIAGRPGAVADRVNAALAKRMAESGLGGVFAPVAIAVDASGRHSNDLRAALALRSMDVSDRTEVLTYLDLIVGAIGMMKSDIVSAAFASVIRSHPEAAEHAASVVATVERHLENGAVRDGEDTIWSIRAGKDAQGTEQSLWKFASTWGKQLRNGLIDLISEL